MVGLSSSLRRRPESSSWGLDSCFRRNDEFRVYSNRIGITRGSARCMPQHWKSVFSLRHAFPGSSLLLLRDSRLAYAPALAWLCRAASRNLPTPLSTRSFKYIFRREVSSVHEAIPSASLIKLSCLSIRFSKTANTWSNSAPCISTPTVSNSSRIDCLVRSRSRKVALNDSRAARSLSLRGSTVGVGTRASTSFGEVDATVDMGVT